MKFVHVMIRVKDIDASMRFYTELLDMNRTGEVVLDDCTLYYLSDEDGQTQIELTYNKETPENGYENGNAFGHLAFETNSMEEFSKRMQSMGYEYLYEPYFMPEVNMHIAFLKDPDGNEIEIMSKQ
ncbi:lactoylglutathione lyase [Clostridium sp. CAG:729]|nr:lactoylglutathione lyase [Clostridium sp. CAG:729]